MEPPFLSFRLSCKETNNTESKRKKKCYDNRFSRKSMEALMAKLTDNEFFGYFKYVSFEKFVTVDVENIICSHSSIFIGGNILC